MVRDRLELERVRASDIAWLVECLSSIHKALGSMLNTASNRNGGAGL